MSCITSKNGYFSENEVQEALIRSQIRFHKGATNYYRCDSCNEFHLTSQKSKHPILADPEVIARIKRERLALDWEKRR